MISHYLLKVSLNHVTLCILAYLHPSHLLRNKGDTANFDLKKPNFCQLLNLYFSFYLLGNLIQNDNISVEIFAIYFMLLKDVVF